GAGRLLLTEDADTGDLFRLRARVSRQDDQTSPGPVAELKLLELAGSSARFSFVAPGDDGDEGIVAGYDVRIMAGTPITADNFDQALPSSVQIAPDEPGVVQLFDIDNLLPNTNYYVGVRARDECN